MSDIEKNVTDDFIHEGLKRYREASATLVAFGEEMERRLQSILAEGPGSGWGRFVPGSNARARSTRNWSKYPLLNAYIEGEIDGSKCTIAIAVNWYESDGTYPFYALSIEPAANYLDAMRNFAWRDDIALTRGGIRYDPDPYVLDLEEGFKLLLDETVRFLEWERGWR